MRAHLLIAALLPGLACGCTGGVTTYTGSFTFSQLPENDDALATWLRDQADFDKASVTREGKTVKIRYSRDEPRWEFKHLWPPFEEMGYQGVRGSFGWTSSRSHNRILPWLPDLVTLVLIYVILHAGVEGAKYLRRRREQIGKPGTPTQPPTS